MPTNQLFTQISPESTQKINTLELLQREFTKIQNFTYLENHSLAESDDPFFIKSSQISSLYPNIHTTIDLRHQISQLKHSIQEDLSREIISAIFSQNHTKIWNILIASDYFSFSALLHSNHLEGRNLLSTVHRMGDWETIITLIETKQCAPIDLLNFRSDDGKSLLLSAIQEQRSDVALKIIQSDIFSDELLTLSSDDPTVTPLSCAIALKQTKVVTSLEYAISLNYPFLLERFKQSSNFNALEFIDEISLHEKDTAQLISHVHFLGIRVIKRQLLQADDQYIFIKGIMKILVASYSFRSIQSILHETNYPFQILQDLLELTENDNNKYLDSIILKHINQLDDHTFEAFMEQIPTSISNRIFQFNLNTEHYEIILRRLNSESGQKVIQAFIESHESYFIDIIVNCRNYFFIQILAFIFDLIKDKPSIVKAIYTRIAQEDEYAIQIFLNHCTLNASKLFAEIALTNKDNKILLCILERDHSPSECLRVQDPSKNNPLIHLIKDKSLCRKTYYDVLIKLIQNTEICPLEILFLENNSHQTLFDIALFTNNIFILKALKSRADFPIDIQFNDLESIQMHFLTKYLQEKNPKSKNITFLNLNKYQPENIQKLYCLAMEQNMHYAAFSLAKKFTRKQLPFMMDLLTIKASNGKTILLQVLENKNTGSFERLVSHLTDSQLSILLNLPNNEGETILIKAIQKQENSLSIFASRMIRSQLISKETLLASTSQGVTAFNLAVELQDTLVIDAFCGCKHIDLEQQRKNITDNLLHKISLNETIYSRTIAWIWNTFPKTQLKEICSKILQLYSEVKYYHGQAFLKFIQHTLEYLSLDFIKELLQLKTSQNDTFFMWLIEVDPFIVKNLPKILLSDDILAYTNPKGENALMKLIKERTDESDFIFSSWILKFNFDFTPLLLERDLNGDNIYSFALKAQNTTILKSLLTYENKYPYNDTLHTYALTDFNIRELLTASLTNLTSMENPHIHLRTVLQIFFKHITDMNALLTFPITPEGDTLLMLAIDLDFQEIFSFFPHYIEASLINLSNNKHETTLTKALNKSLSVHFWGEALMDKIQNPDTLLIQKDKLKIVTDRALEYTKFHTLKILRKFPETRQLIEESNMKFSLPEFNSEYSDSEESSFALQTLRVRNSSYEPIFTDTDSDEESSIFEASDLNKRETRKRARIYSKEYITKKYRHNTPPS